MSVPQLRFPGFDQPWKPTAVGSLIEKKSDAVDVDLTQNYRQIGIRSHGKGIFHKEAVTGAELGDKRVFHVVQDALVVNIVFAWEQAVALTSNAESGFIASHRFPMFIEKNGKSYLPFLRHMFLTKRGKLLLEIASPGGAGRNKTLGQQAFLKLKPVVPSRPEQKKIADAIDAVDAKLAALGAKRAALGRFKAGLMQKLFSQQLRFTRDDGQAFPDWQEKRLGDLLTVRYGKDHKGLPKGDIPVFGTGGVMRHVDRALHSGPSVLIGRKGTIDQPRFVTSPFWTVDTLFYSDIKQGFLPFFVYLVVQSINWLKFNEATGVPSLSVTAIHGVKVTVPPHPDEQQKIADALSAMDARIGAVAGQVARLERFKKGLLQQMFV